MKYKKSKNVTIIIVTYKSKHIIAKTLENIINQKVRIIIIDNGSNDNIEQFLLEKYPNSGLELILLDNNCGFSRANNLALAKVTTKYAFLLNPDTVISISAIDDLINIADKDENIALANPQDVSEEEYYKQSKKIDNKEEIIVSNFVCGGYLLMRMSVFHKIGFFDENLFLYGEDDELSSRSIMHGYKNIIATKIYVFHNEHSSTIAPNKLVKLQLYFNRYWYLGWSRAYLRFKRSNISPLMFFIKNLFQLLSIIFLLIIFRYKLAFARLARSCGALSYLFKINCFNKNNKITKLNKHIII